MKKISLAILALVLGTGAAWAAGLLLLGLEPGVSMITTNLDMTYTIIWSLALANILGAGLCLMLARPVAQLLLLLGRARDSGDPLGELASLFEVV